ncbi:MAG: hypothetical protein JNK67_02850 [Alphaproteobacteria bacterium]|nr:hypothetical protein [Alphaproteobacteria bacterium]
MTTTIAIDALIVLLLLATIGFAWRLDRRLAALKRERGQLADLMTDFSKAAASADEGLKALKLAADDIGRGLETLVAKGQGLRDDLGYLVERGEPLADRLADGVRARGAAPAPAAPQPPPAATAAPAATASASRAESARPVLRASRDPVGQTEPRSEIERELLKALAALR